MRSSRLWTWQLLVLRWWLRWRFRRQYRHLVCLNDGWIFDHPALFDLHGSTDAYRYSRVTALLIQIVDLELARRHG